MQEEKVIFESGGKRLAGLLGTPPKVPAPGVVLLHGLSNSKSDCPLINEVTSALLTNGFFTFRFDYAGSGESPGLLKDKTLEEMRQNTSDAIDFITMKEGVEGIGLWGRSLGGTFAILCGMDSRVNALVLASTDVYITRTLGKARFEELRNMELDLEAKGKVLPGTGRYKGPMELGEKFFNSLPKVEHEVLESIPKLSGVLVLATTPDVKIPLENSVAIINGAREPKAIHIFEGADHDYKGVEGKALDYVVGWFTRLLL